MEKSKNIISLAALVIMASIGGVFFVISNSPDTNTATVQNEASSAKTKKTFSLADVASHNDVASCWVAIRENVYDVTPWVSGHPGGSEAILSLCGKDGTLEFTKQHEGQEKPEGKLEGFLIGQLK